MQLTLAADGLQVVTAASGAEAIAVVVNDRPVNLIVLDVMMPDMDGYEVAGRMKGNAATQSIPIIMVTGLVDRDARMRGLLAGAATFFDQTAQSRRASLAREEPSASQGARRRR